MACVRFLLPEKSVVPYISDEPILSGAGKVVRQRKACDMVVVRSKSVAGPGGVEAHPWAHFQTIFLPRPRLFKIVHVPISDKTVHLGTGHDKPGP
jgi:hypothetical protein